MVYANIDNTSGQIDELTIKYHDDFIEVITYEEHNGCAKYKGVINLVGDTIELSKELIPDSELCLSNEVYKISYLIDNPRLKKKVFVKK